MNENASRLLRDLAVLLRKYRPEDFEELANFIRRPEFTSALARLLTELATTGRRVPSVRRASRTSDLLEKVRNEDKARYVLIRNAREKLSDKGLYPSLRDLIRTIESSGVPLRKGVYRRRDDVVRAFVQVASEMSTSELGEALVKMGVPKTTSDLRSWSNIILPGRVASERRPKKV